jgi:hypothetical protein
MKKILHILLFSILTVNIQILGQEYSRLRGAFYFRADADISARIGEHPDILIRLGDAEDKLIFRRNRGFLPTWYCSGGEIGFDELISRSGCNNTINEYSRVVIIENSPARSIIHWRYAVDCGNVNTNAWVDEYFTIYPDGRCIRTVKNTEGVSTLQQWENLSADIYNLQLSPKGIESVQSQEIVSLTINSENYSYDGFSNERGNYSLQSNVTADPTELNLILNPGDKTVKNPVIVLKNWGDAKAEISVNDQQPEQFYTGYSPDMYGDHLVLWLSLESSDAVDINIKPVDGSGKFVNRTMPPDFGYEFEEVPPLPMGSPDPGKFGAYYTHLKFNSKFDEPWKVGEHSDVVVQFEDNSHRFVFWRGTNYQPHLAGDTYETPYSNWYGTQFVERRGEDWDMPRYLEPMSDWDCRYSHVRIISSNNARAIVQWRYAPCHLDYSRNITEDDPWGDWANEYYTIYPDAISVRKVTAFSRRTGKTNQEDPHIEFHEAIPIINPGTLPEENIHWNSLSATNYDGNKRNWITQDARGGAMEDLDEITNKPIFVVRMKGSTVPLSVVEGIRVVHDPVGSDNCRPFNQYDDWPAWPDNDRSFKDPEGLDWLWNEDPNTYCYRNFYKQYPSHSSMFHVKWYDYEHIQDVKRTKIMLFGMVDADKAVDINNFIPLAKSWNFAPGISINSSGFSGGVYDKTERAYKISRDSESANELNFTINAGSNSSVYNPCIVIKNWDSEVTLKVDGEIIPFRQGIEMNSDEVPSLVVWFRRESSSPISVSITDILYTDVNDNKDSPFRQFSLFQNYPNPFNPSTKIKFQLPETADVKLEIYDVLGRKIRTIVSELKTAGSYSVIWDGKDHYGNNISSGVYFYKLKASKFVDVKKMLLLH